jgi:HSP20 family protein
MTTIKIHRAPTPTKFEREIDRFLTEPPALFQFPLGRLFAPVFSFASPTKAPTWMPLAEMTEMNDKYFITAEVPGLKKEDLTIEFADGVLTVSGEKKEEEKHEEARFYAFERSYGYFERVFAFPGEVNPERIAATVTDGVLRIQVPKAAATKVEAKKIPVTEGK